MADLTHILLILLIQAQHTPIVLRRIILDNKLLFVFSGKAVRVGQILCDHADDEHRDKSSARKRVAIHIVTAALQKVQHRHDQRRAARQRRIADVPRLQPEIQQAEFPEQQRNRQGKQHRCIAQNNLPLTAVGKIQQKLWEYRGKRNCGNFHCVEIDDGNGTAHTFYPSLPECQAEQQQGVRQIVTAR